MLIEPSEGAFTDQLPLELDQRLRSPQWLLDAHAALDTVAAAYGWSTDITDADALRELLALNGGG